MTTRVSPTGCPVPRSTTYSHPRASSARLADAPLGALQGSPWRASRQAVVAGPNSASAKAVTWLFSRAIVSDVTRVTLSWRGSCCCHG